MLRFRAMSTPPGTPGAPPSAPRKARPERAAAGQATMDWAAPAMLTSRDNRWLKQFRMALRGGIQTESGFVGVEGVRLVEEALRSGCGIDAVLFSETGARYSARLAAVFGRPGIGFSE